jgi:predicted metal-dependent hydrolase
MTQLELPLLAPVRPRGAGTIRAVKLRGRVLTYRFRRARRRTIGLVVDAQGLVAAAPRWVGVDEVEGFIREKQDWILAKLAELAAHQPHRVLWEAGAHLPVLGEEVLLAPTCDVREPSLVGNALRVPVGAPRDLRAAVVDWLHGRALAFYRERAAVLAPRIHVVVPQVSLSNARTQWGSCTVGRDMRARVRLHWRLVHLRPALVDYVIAHELAHIREMNHSPRFWRWVGTLYPDFRAARRELRAAAHSLPEL